MICSRRLSLGVLVVALFLGGCGTANVEVFQRMKHGQYFPKKVAILPFTTAKDVLEKEKKPNEILREVFFNYFSYLGYTDLPLEEVDARLQQAGVVLDRDDPQRLPLDNAQLKNLLGVDAVVHGHIIEANNFTGGVHSETLIKARLEMIDLKTEKPSWSVEHKEMDYSGIATPSFVDIVRQQVANVNVQQAYYRTAEAFSLQVVNRIPDPGGLRVKEVHLPAISSLETNLMQGKEIKIRDRIQVDLKGTPGLNASFDIGSWKTGIPLKEITPGHYSGSYEVVEGDHVEKAFVIGNLKNRNGLSGKKYFKSAMVRIRAGKSSTPPDRQYSDN